MKIQLANLMDPLECQRLMEGVDAVVHLANHPWSIPGRHQRVFHNNIAVNTHVFVAARDAGVKRMIFASSINVLFGPNQELNQWTRPRALPMDGNVGANPGNPYGVGKHASERLLQFMTRTGPMTGIALRFPSLVADGDRVHRHQWFQNHLEHPEELPLEPLFYLSHTDVGRVLEAALHAPLSGYHCFFPSLLLSENMPLIKTMIERHWPELSSTVDWNMGFGALINPVPLERDLGWTPRPALQNV